MVIQLLFRLSITGLILLSYFFLQDIGLYILIFTGILSGIYYGWYNDIIWCPENRLKKAPPYRVHQLWIHIISGVVGSFSLYFLFTLIKSTAPIDILQKIGIKEFALLLLAMLGYTGLLPRMFWFYSSRGGGS